MVATKSTEKHEKRYSNNEVSILIIATNNIKWQQKIHAAYEALISKYGQNIKIMWL